MSTPPTTGGPPNRMAIGLNVTIAAAAALALVVGVNFIAYRQYVRFDFTSMGMYSLSPQTRQVLDDLDTPHEIVGIFVEDTEPAIRLGELLQEYDVRSDNLTLTRINPVIDAVRFDTFLARMEARYADKLDPARTTLRQSIDRVQAGWASVIPILIELRDALDAGSVSGRLNQVVTVLPQISSAWEQSSSSWNDQLDQALPAVGQIVRTMQRQLEEINTQTLAAAQSILDDAGSNSTLPGAVRDAALRAAAAIDTLRVDLQNTTDQLAAINGLEDYNQLVDDLVGRECVIVLADDKARVIARDAMITPETFTDDSQRESEYRFQAEEKITGALISLSLDQRPLAVFVSYDPRPVIGPRGSHEHVASRLRSADFQLETWNPMGQMSPMGGMAPAGPPPTPEPGQPAVWVVLPAPPPDPRNPMSNPAAAKQQVAAILAERLAAGDGALLMTSTDPGARFGTSDPIAELAAEWGIDPLLEQIILAEVRVNERQTQATTMHDLRDWPDDHPVSKALAGLPGVMIQASPLQLVDPAPEETPETDTPAPTTTTWALAHATSPRMWATAEAAAAGSLEQMAFDPEQAADTFTVAAAAERPAAGRLILIADPIFASDDITTYGMTILGPAQGFPDTAIYPANAELFVNSVYWLSGMDHLIAASSRTQRVARVGAISDETYMAYQFGLLLGLPLIILATGLGVYFSRRAG
ncbi:GldG family protein [Mucisphaera calidilacus]|uniref:ABC-type uncharacterized transport system n=1 Tax=Mucisphaera calidilacus TaxID=2527982 RepID=A0A518BV56_9BACT|nr:GldG family protein [Mucisphaera calidilacus]QDU70858.1 ABC-type uncharacterized transport system [Mucisphaera calidilacus]